MNIENMLKTVKELRKEYPSDMELSEIHNDLIKKYEKIENEMVQNIV